jgi:tetratricopeptide (TPR) repeat protein
VVSDKLLVLASRTPGFQGYGAKEIRRYLRTGDPAALSNALDALGFSAITTRGSRGRGRLLCLNNLSQALCLSFERTGEPDVLREAIETGREAVALCEHRYRRRRPTVLSNLCLALRAEFERTGDLEVAEEAVSVGSAALAAADRWNRSQCLSNLATARIDLFEHTGDLDMLRAAISELRRAVPAARLRRERKGWYLSNLGMALHELFEYTGHLDALREAVTVSSAAAAIIRPDHPRRAMRLNNLGLTQLSLSLRTGDVPLLREAISTYRAALDSAVSDSFRMMIWNNLGLGLNELFSFTGDLNLLREAVTAARSAVAVTADGNIRRASFQSNLAISLSTLFDRTGDLDALREAVTVHRAVACDIPDDHPDKPGLLTSLGSELHTLSEQVGDPQLLAEAIATERAAVAALDSLPDGHRMRAVCLANLGASLGALFSQSGDLDILREAIDLERAAAMATGDDHPDQAARLVALGDSLITLHERTGVQEALPQARAVLTQAAGSAVAPVAIRIWAGRTKARADTLAGDVAAALAAMQDVVRLLPMMASRELHISDRHHQLGREVGIGAQASAYALASGQPVLALELLEQARGLLLGEALGSRSESTRLRRLAPDLADEFNRLRNLLDATDATPTDHGWVLSTQDDNSTAAQLSHRDQKVAAQHIGDHRRVAAQSWEALLGRIRERPGLADFLVPTPISQLQQQARPGPIVFVLADASRCDALALTADQTRPVEHIPLPGLTRGDAYREAAAHLKARANATLSKDMAQRQEANDEISRILGWLWDTVTGPILSQLGYADSPDPGGTWPRLWWCPVGVMAALPLHAAGYHHGTAGRADAPRTVLDRVVSSYTATARILGYARQTPSMVPDHGRDGTALIVGLPDTSDADELPAVRDEMLELIRLMPTSSILEGPAATRDNVLSALTVHPVAHFACHAVTGTLNDPYSTRLIIAEDKIRPLTISAISRAHIPRADLAYLSACSTANSDGGDETVHITSAFQLAGYRNVVGTLWPVGDRTAHRIAAAFYARLTEDGDRAPEADESALSLHHAIRGLRAKNPGAPVQWTAHVHIGV